MKLTLVYSDCYPNKTCPAVWDTDTEDLLIQGPKVTDPQTLAFLDVPDHECVSRIPRDVLREAVRRLGWR